MMDTTLLLRYYNEEKYPFDLLSRMVTMNTPFSPQCRDLAVQFSNGIWWKHFVRTRPCDLRRKIISSRTPALHIAVFRQVPIRPEQCIADTCYDSGQEEEEDVAADKEIILRDDFSQSQGGFRVVQPQKELVFDMDITDFTRFCPCVETKLLCNVCWLHMLGAHLILSHFLTEIVGYSPENMLWVFSGGKGLHCFVNSSRCLRFSDEERKNLLRLLTRHCDQNSDANLSQYLVQMQQTEPAFVERITNLFLECGIKQRDLLRYDAFRQFARRHILRLTPDVLRTRLEKQWSPVIEPRDTDSFKRANLDLWLQLLTLELEEAHLFPVRPSVWLAFRLFYPMVDEKPLLEKHQIKTPFSIHPRTKNISLPLTPDEILGFLPTQHNISLERLMNASDSSLVMKRFENAKKLLGHWIDYYNK